MSTIAAGIHSEVTREEYDGIDRLNYSKLKLMAKSPAHYMAAPRKDSDAMKLGRAVHLAVLEPDRFAAEVAIWTGERRAGKLWEAFKEANAGKELLSEEEHRQAHLVAEAVRNDPTAARYLTVGTPETTVLWDAGGHACKSRLDWVGTSALVDLKSTRDASPASFGRDAYNMHYAAQAAFYSDAHYVATGEALPFVIVAVEPNDPFAVVTYRIPDALIALGRQQYLSWLDRLTYCLERKTWPSYAEGEIDLCLPRWAEGVAS